MFENVLVLLVRVYFVLAILVVIAAVMVAVHSFYIHILSRFV